MRCCLNGSGVLRTAGKILCDEKSLYDIFNVIKLRATPHKEGRKIHLKVLYQPEAVSKLSGLFLIFLATILQ